MIPNNSIRQILFLLLILLVGVILFVELKGFIPALLGSYTLYVLLRNWNFRLVHRHNWKPGLSAALLMLMSFIVILLPVFLLINMMSSKISFAVQHSTEVMTKIEGFIQKYEEAYGIEIMNAATVSKVSSAAANSLPTILGATINTITTIIVMYFLLFFMLTQGRKMEAGFYTMVPLKNDNIHLIRTELNTLVYSNAVGIPLIAIMQGVVGLIGYFIIGVHQPMFWFVITCIAAMIPMVGAALAYVPLALLFFAEGDTTRGVMMLAFGFGVIGTVDNIFRFWLQKKIGDVHPIITVFGVIIGVKLFGFIGLIFGPILISLFLLLVRVYSNEFHNTAPADTN